MAEKKTPNGIATQFRSGEEAAKNGQKGGRASGKRRREKKTIRKILSDYLDSGVGDIPALERLADVVGVSEEASVKELFVMACLLRSIEDGELADLERLMKMLGEDVETNGSEEKLDGLLKEFRDAVKSEAT